MTKDDRLRYSITPENHHNLLLLQSFAVINGKKSPNLSELVNRAIEIMFDKALTEMMNDGNIYHRQFAELLSAQIERELLEDGHKN